GAASYATNAVIVAARYLGVSRLAVDVAFLSDKALRLVNGYLNPRDIWRCMINGVPLTLFTLLLSFPTTSFPYPPALRSSPTRKRQSSNISSSCGFTPP
ncbi:hypothetical protein D6D23_10596, partial [Aureobasidium pullulans]